MLVETALPGGVRSQRLAPLVRGAFSFRNRSLSGRGDLQQEYVLLASSSYLGKSHKYEVAELRHGEALLEQPRLRAAAGVTREKTERAQLVGDRGYFFVPALELIRYD
jgi:hypothetical protein